MSNKRKVTDKGDYYFSISGSKSDGFAVHYYRKLGWDSVTSEFKQVNLTLEGLIEFLSVPENHTRSGIKYPETG